MQEIAERLQRIEGLLNTANTRMQRIEDTLAGWRTTLAKAGRKEKNALRRKQYREAAKRKQEGLVPLPEKHILKFRDKRLKPRFAAWAQMGMRFGAANQPEQFFTWLVHAWNNCSYLRKPVTFSGSSFRIWDCNHRFSYGPRDLMGYACRKNEVQLLRNAAEHDDFGKRPWWDWCYAVLSPVVQEMQEMGFEELPERFQRLVKIMVGGWGGHEVYTGLTWDFQESRENINKMFRRMGTDLQLILKACYIGLRVRGTASPVPLPAEQQ